MKNVILTLWGVLLVTTAFAQQNMVIDRIVGKVDNFFILRSDIEQMYLQYQNEQPDKAISKCQCLNSLIVERVMLAKAEIDSVVVEEKQVDNELTGRMEQMVQMYGSEKNLVEQFGKSLEQLKAELRPDVKNQLVVQEMRRKISNEVKITPSEIKKYFNAIPKDSLPYLPAEVEVEHIVRLAKVTKEEKSKLRERLLEFKRQALAGSDFAALATTHSEDVGSAQNGGLYANIKRGTMVPEFEGTVYRLKPNEIADPVETEYGLHLIKLESLRGEVYTARHILLRPDYNRLDLTEATAFLDSIRTLVIADSIKFEKAAKEFSEDKATSDAGGYLQDPESRSTHLPLDASMEPTLFFTLDTMKVGYISRPINYRTNDGKTAMRILYYRKKFDPHTANLKDDYIKIQRIALGRKRNNAVETWFSKAKKEVLIQLTDPDLRTECQDIYKTLGGQ